MSTMAKIKQRIEKVAISAQRLGLNSEYRLKFWNQWWDETDLDRKVPIIRMGRGWASRRGTRQIINNYTRSVPASKKSLSFEYVLAHEMGHVFLLQYGRKRSVAPKGGFSRIFNRGRPFGDDPYNELCDWLAEHPDAVLDSKNWISWYAWSDWEEDFCECFAEVVLRPGRIKNYRQQKGVYTKLNTILESGRRRLACLM